MKSPFKYFGGRAAWLCLFFVLTQCGKPTPPQNLLDTAHLSSWKPAGIPEEGQVIVEKDQITLHSGAPMTGVRFEAWQTPAFPTTRYAIDYEAMRVSGSDFFGTLTFPVGQSHLSFVMGGWGGNLVGLSSIDYQDASENSTRGNLDFINDRWYHVRIEVRDDEIRAWIDQKPFINVNITGRRLELRGGHIEKCLPFGFTTYLSSARIRSIVLERL